MAVVRRSLLALLFSVSAVVFTAQAASSPGNIAACYSPMHSQAYPFGREALNMDNLKQSIDNDFALMAKHVTHVRTYYSQHFGLPVAQYAAKHGLKLYLGVYMTTEAWGSTEIDAAVDAAKQFPDTVEAIIVGNENLHTGTSAAAILGVVNQIRSRVGSTPVKFGTVQRITEYVDPNYDAQTKQLEASLDILGVNIYPFFDPHFDASKPADLVNTLWNRMAAKFDVTKMRLTETGFPTDGAPSAEAPNVLPNLDTSFSYYNALRQWVPQGGESTPKFWFGMFDRRPDDNTMGLEFEKHFGFYTSASVQKRPEYPLLLTDAPAPAPAPAPQPAPAPAPAPQPAPAPAPGPQPAPAPAPAPTPAPAPAPVTTPAPQPQPTPAPQVTPAPQPQPTPAPQTTPAPQPVQTTATPVKPTPAPTWTLMDSNNKPTPAPSSNDKPTPAPSSNDKPTPAPSSNGKPTPAPSANGKPTPAPSSNGKPTPAPSSNGKPTPAPSNGKPTPAPSSNGKPTPAPSSTEKPSKLRGSDSSSSMANDSVAATVSLVSDKSVAKDADMTTPSTTTPAPTTTFPSKDAKSKTSGSSLVQPSRLLVAIAALVATMVHLL